MIGVSCICPTFGRTNLLPEAVESFLRQDYEGDMELVIVNDLPQQTIKCDAKNVRVINVRDRFPSLGQKRSFSYKQARMPLILTWGDDDIHLPHRVQRAVKGLSCGKMALEGWHFCLYDKELRYNKFSTTGAHIVDANFASSVGYFSCLNTGEDADFNKRAEKLIGPLLSIAQPPAFIYRWYGTDRPHISAFHSNDGKRDAYKIVGDSIFSLIESGKEPSGEVEIIPHWKQDYVTLANQHI